jgi:hypothetical protein
MEAALETEELLTMTLRKSLGTAFAATVLSSCATTMALPHDVDEAALRAVDERQRQIISGNDVRGMTEIAHSNLRINAPTNQVLTREQLLAMMESGDIGAENFVRVPEAVTISGNIGIVMGHESFTPTATSASGRMFGLQPLKRRYTNVYVFEAGRWQFLSRHANVIAPPSMQPR